MYGLVVALSACWVVAAEPRIYADTLAITGQAWQFNLINWLAGSVLIFGCLRLLKTCLGLGNSDLIVVAISYTLFR